MMKGHKEIWKLGFSYHNSEPILCPCFCFLYSSSSLSLYLCLWINCWPLTPTITHTHTHTLKKKRVGSAVSRKFFLMRKSKYIDLFPECLDIKIFFSESYMEAMTNIYFLRERTPIIIDIFGCAMLSGLVEFVKLLFSVMNFLFFFLQECLPLSYLMSHNPRVGRNEIDWNSSLDWTERE